MNSTLNERRFSLGVKRKGGAGVNDVGGMLLVQSRIFVNISLCSVSPYIPYCERVE